MSLPLYSPAAAQPGSPPRRFADSPTPARVGVCFAAPPRSVGANAGFAVVDGLGRFFAPQTSDRLLFALVRLAPLRRRALSASGRRFARAAGSTDSFQLVGAAAPRSALAAAGWTARGSPAPGGPES